MLSSKQCNSGIINTLYDRLAYRPEAENQRKTRDWCGSYNDDIKQNKLKTIMLEERIPTNRDGQFRTDNRVSTVQHTASLMHLSTQILQEKSI